MLIVKSGIKSQIKHLMLNVSGVFVYIIKKKRFCVLMSTNTLKLIALICMLFENIAEITSDVLIWFLCIINNI